MRIQDVVIVGAPRSGTNMLRDVLTSMPGMTTWPCDEIPLIWRHGNRSHPDDELAPDQATPRVAAFIRGEFEKIRGRNDAEVVVEKTCATSLRTAFVREILPEAKYVLITRDGLDAAASAMQRWHAPFDLRYTAAKARFVPPGDVPYYGARALSSRLRHRTGEAGATSADQVGSWWGPKPREHRAWMRQHPLDEVSLLQWKRCVDVAEAGLESLPDDQLHRITYEDFVARPAERTRDLLSFLERPDTDVEAAVSSVSGNSVGKGRSSFSPADVRRLELLLGQERSGSSDA